MPFFFRTALILRRLTRLILLGALLTTSLTGLAQPLPVVASFSLLGDLVARVGGERVRVSTLVGPGSDAHVFQPTPADARRLAQARLVLVNGLGFEGWIERLIKSSGYKGPVVVASLGVSTLEREPGAPDRQAHKYAHGHADPHAWQDVRNTLIYVDNIAQGLGRVDPEGQPTYARNAAKLKAELAALDTDLRQAFAALPSERRKVVSSHDAFAYFSRAYGIRFIAPAGLNNEAEPSAAELARIIQLVRREKVPAVFMENISDPRLAERIRAESGARIGGTLYSDALSPAGGPADTYARMMRHNAEALLKALRD